MLPNGKDDNEPDSYGYIKCRSCKMKTRRSMQFNNGCEVRLNEHGQWMRGCQYSRLTPHLKRMVDTIVGRKKR